MGKQCRPRSACRVLHCLPFRQHLLFSLLYGRATLFKFLDNYSNFLGVGIFRNFTVNLISQCSPCDTRSILKMHVSSMLKDIYVILNFKDVTCHILNFSLLSCQINKFSI